MPPPHPTPTTKTTYASSKLFFPLSAICLSAQSNPKITLFSSIYTHHFSYIAASAEIFFRHSSSQPSFNICGLSNADLFQS